MTAEQLRERIKKAEEKVEKAEKRVSKWKDAQTKEAFLKADKWLLDLGRDEESLWMDYIMDCQRELKRAESDLSDAKVLVEKYRNLLALEEAKDDEFNNNRIMVIWNFILNYKEKVAEYIRGNMEILNKYYEIDSELCDWHNNKRLIMKEKGISEQEWKDHYWELRQKVSRIKSDIHPITLEVVHSNGYGKPKTVDEDKLEEILMKDCKNRYLKLVQEVTKYTGVITDATGLYMMAGELNGIIVGERGKAKVQTFSAGGWHIQCFHYRHKVTPIK